MSCNGCRVLRKGCNDKCILRQSLSGIESFQAQSHATVFVAKFFGRAGLMSFLSAVPDSQRPALFQSLLFEACGRTINPVSGAVGLLWTGNWHVCQSAVESVLRGGLLQPISQFTGEAPPLNSSHKSSCTNDMINIDFFRSNNNNNNNSTTTTFSMGPPDFTRNMGIKGQDFIAGGADLDLCLTHKRQSLTGRMTASGRPDKKKRSWTPNSDDESGTTTFESGLIGGATYDQNPVGPNNKLLKLFF